MLQKIDLLVNGNEESKLVEKRAAKYSLANSNNISRNISCGIKETSSVFKQENSVDESHAVAVGSQLLRSLRSRKDKKQGRHNKDGNYFQSRYNTGSLSHYEIPSKSQLRIKHDKCGLLSSISQIASSPTSENFTHKQLLSGNKDVYIPSVVPEKDITSDTLSFIAKNGDTRHSSRQNPKTFQTCAMSQVALDHCSHNDDKVPVSGCMASQMAKSCDENSLENYQLITVPTTTYSAEQNMHVDCTVSVDKPWSHQQLSFDKEINVPHMSSLQANQLQSFQDDASSTQWYLTNFPIERNDWRADKLDNLIRVKKIMLYKREFSSNSLVGTSRKILDDKERASNNPATNCLLDTGNPQILSSVGKIINSDCFPEIALASKEQSTNSGNGTTTANAKTFRDRSTSAQANMLNQNVEYMPFANSDKQIYTGIIQPAFGDNGLHCMPSPNSSSQNFEGGIVNDLSSEIAHNTRRNNTRDKFLNSCSSNREECRELLDDNIGIQNHGRPITKEHIYEPSHSAEFGSQVLDACTDTAVEPFASREYGINDEEAVNMQVFSCKDSDLSFSDTEISNSDIESSGNESDEVFEEYFRNEHVNNKEKSSKTPNVDHSDYLSLFPASSVLVKNYFATAQIENKTNEKGVPHVTMLDEESLEISALNDGRGSCKYLVAPGKLVNDTHTGREDSAHSTKNDYQRHSDLQNENIGRDGLVCSILNGGFPVRSNNKMNNSSVRGYGENYDNVLGNKDGKKTDGTKKRKKENIKNLVSDGTMCDTHTEDLIVEESDIDTDQLAARLCGDDSVQVRENDIPEGTKRERNYSTQSASSHGERHNDENIVDNGQICGTLSSNREKVIMQMSATLAKKSSASVKGDNTENDVQTKTNNTDSVRKISTHSPVSDYHRHNGVEKRLNIISDGKICETCDDILVEKLNITTNNSTVSFCGDSDVLFKENVMITEDMQNKRIGPTKSSSSDNHENGDAEKNKGLISDDICDEKSDVVECEVEETLRNDATADMPLEISATNVCSKCTSLDCDAEKNECSIKGMTGSLESDPSENLTREIKLNSEFEYPSNQQNLFDAIGLFRGFKDGTKAMKEDAEFQHCYSWKLICYHAIKYRHHKNKMMSKVHTSLKELNMQCKNNIQTYTIAANKLSNSEEPIRSISVLQKTSSDQDVNANSGEKSYTLMSELNDCCNGSSVTADCRISELEHTNSVRNDLDIIFTQNSNTAPDAESSFKKLNVPERHKTVKNKAGNSENVNAKRLSTASAHVEFFKILFDDDDEITMYDFIGFDDGLDSEGRDSDNQQIVLESAKKQHPLCQSYSVTEDCLPGESSHPVDLKEVSVTLIDIAKYCPSLASYVKNLNVRKSKSLLEESPTEFSLSIDEINKIETECSSHVTNIKKTNETHTSIRDNRDSEFHELHSCESKMVAKAIEGSDGGQISNVNWFKENRKILKNTARQCLDSSKSQQKKVRFAIDFEEDNDYVVTKTSSIHGEQSEKTNKTHAGIKDTGDSKFLKDHPFVSKIIGKPSEGSDGGRITNVHCMKENNATSNNICKRNRSSHSVHLGTKNKEVSQSVYKRTSGRFQKSKSRKFKDTLPACTGIRKINIKQANQKTNASDVCGAVTTHVLASCAKSARTETYANAVQGTQTNIFPTHSHDISISTNIDSDSPKESFDLLNNPLHDTKGKGLCPLTTLNYENNIQCTKKDCRHETEKYHHHETDKDSCQETEKDISCETENDSMCETERENHHKAEKDSSHKTKKDSRYETEKDSSCETEKNSSHETKIATNSETDKKRMGTVLVNCKMPSVSFEINTSGCGNELINCNGVNNGRLNDRSLNKSRHKFGVEKGNRINFVLGKDCDLHTVSTINDDETQNTNININNNPSKVTDEDSRNFDLIDNRSNVTSVPTTRDICKLPYIFRGNVYGSDTHTVTKTTPYTTNGKIIKKVRPKRYKHYFSEHNAVMKAKMDVAFTSDCEREKCGNSNSTPSITIRHNIHKNNTKISSQESTTNNTLDPEANIHAHGEGNVVCNVTPKHQNASFSEMHVCKTPKFSARQTDNDRTLSDHGENSGSSELSPTKTHDHPTLFIVSVDIADLNDHDMSSSVELSDVDDAEKVCMTIIHVDSLKKEVPGELANESRGDYRHDRSNVDLGSEDVRDSISIPSNNSDDIDSLASKKKSSEGCVLMKFPGELANDSIRDDESNYQDDGSSGNLGCEDAKDSVSRVSNNSDGIDFLGFKAKRSKRHDIKSGFSSTFGKLSLAQPKVSLHRVKNLNTICFICSKCDQIYHSKIELQAHHSVGCRGEKAGASGCRVCLNKKREALLDVCESNVNKTSGNRSQPVLNPRTVLSDIIGQVQELYKRSKVHGHTNTKLLRSFRFDKIKGNLISLYSAGVGHQINNKSKLKDISHFTAHPLMENNTHTVSILPNAKNSCELNSSDSSLLQDGISGIVSDTIALNEQNCNIFAFDTASEVENNVTMVVPVLSTTAEPVQKDEPLSSLSVNIKPSFPLPITNPDAVSTAGKYAVPLVGGDGFDMDVVTVKEEMTFKEEPDDTLHSISEDDCFDYSSMQLNPFKFCNKSDDETEPRSEGSKSVLPKNNEQRALRMLGNKFLFVSLSRVDDYIQRISASTAEGHKMNNTKNSCISLENLVSQKPNEARKYQKHNFYRENGRRCYPCAKCDHIFSNSSDLRRHFRSHTGEKPFKCSLCTKTYRQRTSLKFHMMLHRGEKSYVCQICGIAMSQKAHLTSHMRTHTGERPFKCNTCGKSFARKSHLDSHSLIHGFARPFKCQICFRAFKSSANLNVHTKHHRHDKRHKCIYCSATFVLPCDLKRHKKIHDSQNVCPVCGKYFKTQVNLKKHLKLAHRDFKPRKLLTSK